ncbi:MAG: BON domain-containing protein [Desulfobulbaceae bacterium]|nr:MAG: BON domain-containing protein [Desulfobulbaceae bacterium]
MMNRMCHLALFATLVSTFASCAFLSASKTDDQIEASVQQSYVFRNYLREDNITIQAKDGRVTLTGLVLNESHKFLAGDTVASLSGVLEVENKLKEIPAPSPMHTDELLVSKVQLLLSFHRNVNASETEIFAQDGMVTLHGKATSMVQKDLTTAYVKDVEGVKNVVSEMTVASAGPEQDEKARAQGMNPKDKTIDDASIAVLVEMMLLNHRSTSSLTPIILAKEGVVRLRGNARNAATKELIGKYANDVYGVKRVINEMSFE